MQQDFLIRPASPQTMRWFTALSVLISVLAVLDAVLAVFLRTPELWIGVVVLVLVSWLIFYSARAARSAVIELGRDSFRVRGDLFSRPIPFRELIAAEMRVVDFAAEPGLKPRWKLCGTALSGHQAGFFSLHNGQRAYVFLSDTAGVVHLRTRAGRTILLTPAEPELFLAALREAVAGAIRTQT